MQNAPLNVRYEWVGPTGELPAPVRLPPFKTVIIAASTVNDPAYIKQRAQLSHWLVTSGCLYMMAWGEDCQLWVEAVQRANRASFDTPEIPDRSLIITTAHDVELLNDVFWFAKYTAMHPCCTLQSTLLLHIAATARATELCAQYAAA